MTAHGKKLERMAANADWNHVAGALGTLCNGWAARRDLTVYLGRDGGQGIAPAFFQPKTAEIELNSEYAFGKGSDGTLIGDLTQRSELSKYPTAGGMALHESAHARFTASFWSEIPAMLDNRREWQVFEWLEEARVEGRMVLKFPKDKAYLRACTKTIVMGDDPLAWNPRGAMILLIGRHETGVLDHEDVAAVEAHLVTLGWDMQMQAACRSIIYEFMTLDPQGDELKRQLELARELDILMPYDPPTLEDFLRDLIEDALGKAAQGGRIEAIEEGMAEEAFKERQERERREKIEVDNQIKSKEVFEDSTGGHSAVLSKIGSSRPPTSAERAAAVMLSKDLEKAKYRDRALTEYYSDVPPGRFNGGEAMRREATRRNGGDTSRFKPFRHQRYQETEEPPLTVGVMSDISGSMGRVQASIGTAVYVISEAVYRLDKASAAAVYFGEKVYPGLAKGERLRQVNTWLAHDGEEDFDGGFRALDGELTLLNGEGARLLVVVSDGNYGAMVPRSAKTQRAAAREWLDTCVKNRVGVVWIQLRGQHTGFGGPGVEVVTVDGDILDATDAIGQAAIRALEHVGR
ncbi:AAA-ATPase [Microbacterium phage A3Wally]|nr:AAA-ATPase [Microbacterium phage A3Wally]